MAGTRAISCSVLRAEQQALAQRQAEMDKTEKSPSRRDANRAIDGEPRAIARTAHQFCG